MLGLEDPIVLLAYLLCGASTLLCVVYGIICWNKGDDAVPIADAQRPSEDKRAAGAP